MDNFHQGLGFKKSLNFLKQFDTNFQSLIDEISDPNIYSPNHISETDYYYENLWENSSDFYLIGAKIEFQELFSNELKELNQKETFFKYCKFSTYKTQYESRFKSFKEDFEDGELLDFIKREMNEYIIEIKNHELFCKIGDDDKLRLNLARQKTIDFLINESQKNGYSLIITTEDLTGCETFYFKKNEGQIPLNKSRFKWNIKPTQFVELIMALNFNQNIKGNPTPIIEELSTILDIEVKDISNKIGQIKNRTDSTKFLNELKDSFIDEISK